MSIKYYVQTSLSGKPIWLYKQSVGESSFSEQEWNGTEWKETSELTGYLVAGEFHVNKVPMEQAEQMFPAAFA
jgi:hypothetical protein